jgi:hypothetical protein
MQEQGQNCAEHIQDQNHRERFGVAISRVEIGDQHVIGDELGGGGGADDRSGHHHARQPAM